MFAHHLPRSMLVATLTLCYGNFLMAQMYTQYQEYMEANRHAKRQAYEEKSDEDDDVVDTEETIVATTPTHQHLVSSLGDRVMGASRRISDKIHHIADRLFVFSKNESTRLSLG